MFLAVTDESTPRAKEAFFCSAGFGLTTSTTHGVTTPLIDLHSNEAIVDKKLRPQSTYHDTC